MRRKILLTKLMLVLFVSVCTGQSQDNFHKLLEKLDREIDLRSVFHARREGRIAELKDTLKDPALSESKLIEGYGRLFWDYLTYQTDSAIHYAAAKREVAAKAGIHEKVIEAELNLAQSYAIAGLNKDLADKLAQLSQEDMTPELQRYYLYVHSLLCENVNSLTTNPHLSTRHARDLHDVYTALLEMMTPANSGVWYHFIEAKLLDLEGAIEESRSLLENGIDLDSIDERDLAMYYYLLGKVCEKGAGTTEEANCYYVQAALCDLRCADREHYAIYKLSKILYEQGDIDKAYAYMKVAMEDANFCNAYKRIHQLSQTMPVISSSYQLMRSQKQRMLYILLCVSIASIAMLTCMLIYMVKLSRSYRNATIQLTALNRDLKEVSNDLADANIIKETYIVRYMDLCLENIRQMSDRLRHISRFIKQNDMELVGKSPLRKMLDTVSFENDNLKIFHSNFDSTFLTLFPTFVEEYNKLLTPEGQVVLKNPMCLNTELRIYALVRLGVTNSVKIAMFLQCSLSTVYNNRTNARNKAIVDRDRFEEYVSRMDISIGIIKALKGREADH